MLPLQQLTDMSLDELEMYLVVPVVFIGTFLWDRLIAHDRYTASSVHAVVVTLVATGNLVFELNESFIFLLMTGYFIADILRCCLHRGGIVYLFHHVLTVYSLWYMITTDHLNIHMFASKAALVELSTPFMNKYILSQKMFDGAIFTLTFFKVRILWLGYIAYEGLRVSKYNFEYSLIVLFVGLNWFWFGQIIFRAYAAVIGKHEPYTDDSDRVQVEPPKVDDAPCGLANAPATEGLKKRKMATKG